MGKKSLCFLLRFQFLVEILLAVCQIFQYHPIQKKRTQKQRPEPKTRWKEIGSSSSSSFDDDDDDDDDDDEW